MSEHDPNALVRIETMLSSVLLSQGELTRKVDVISQGVFGGPDQREPALKHIVAANTKRIDELETNIKEQKQDKSGRMGRWEAAAAGGLVSLLLQGLAYFKGPGGTP